MKLTKTVPKVMKTGLLIVVAVVLTTVMMDTYLEHVHKTRIIQRKLTLDTWFNTIISRISSFERGLQSVNITSDSTPPPNATSLTKLQSTISPEITKPILYLYAETKARLGNSMFQIAALYGLFQQSKRSARFFDKTNKLVGYFPNTKDIIGGRINNTKLLNYEKVGYNDTLKRIIIDTPDRNITIEGYLQSWKFFADYFDDIRKLFKVSPDIERRAKLDIQSIRAKCGGGNETVVVGVHVRRGDKASKYEFNLGHRLPNSTYFNNAMDYYRQKYNNPHFIVTSDDAMWCQEKLNFTDVTIPAMTSQRRRNQEDDLALLSLCDHSIMTVGTFGFWAGFLAGGETIYFAHPFAEGSKKYNSNSSPEDFFLPHWKPME